MFIDGPTRVSESKILKPSRAISLLLLNCRPSGAAIFRQGVSGKIALFELALFLQALFLRSRLGTRIGAILAGPLEFLPCSDTLRLELLHEVPQCRPDHLMGEARIPGDRYTKGEMLVEAEIARQPPLHERKRTSDNGAGAAALVLRMGRFELDPVDPGLALVGPQASQAIDQPTARGIAGVALGHHDKVGIELVLHGDGGAITGDRLLDRYDLDPGTLGLALSFDRLVVDAHPGDAGADALAHHAPHRHDPAVTGVAVHDHPE